MRQVGATSRGGARRERGSVLIHRAERGSVLIHRAERGSVLIHRAERGSMLIVALGILMLMSLMAVTFVTLMKLEKAAAVNYADGQRAKLTADSGMVRVLSTLKQTLGKPLFQGGNLAPYVFGARGKEIDVTLDVDDVNARNNPFFWGYIGRQYSNGKRVNVSNPDTFVGIDEYKVKVIETSALLDLNYPTEMETGGRPKDGQIFEQMLEALGQALARGRHRFDPVLSMRFQGPSGNYARAKALIAYRATLDGDRFTSKSQLRLLFPQDNQGDFAYALLRDFVTAHAWRDYSAVKPSASGALNSHHLVVLEERGRSQLNLNLAPKEVMVAVIAPPAGRRYAIYPESQTQLIEQGNEASYFGMTAGGARPRPASYKLREETSYAVHEGYVYLAPIGVARAEQIANWIVAQRPFFSMADFHQRILQEMDKASGALDGSLPQANPSEARIVAKPDPRYNLSGIHNQPWFPDFVRKAGYSLLLANFNPNFCSNSVNPNQAAAYPIDKASLVYPVDWSRRDPDTTVRSHQTVDACFEPRGIYELTSLGQIRGTSGEIMAREKAFRVVKTFDMTVQRTQFDFEENDLTYAPDNGGPERDGVVSHPENPTFYKGPNSAQRSDTPDLMVAKAWGYLEVAPRPHFAWNETLAIRDVAEAEWGSPIFAAMFDGMQKGLNPGLYLHASMGDKINITDQRTPTTFQGARGEALWLARNSSNWRVTAGTGTLYRDGFYAGHRKNRDLTLWYPAGAERGPNPAGVKVGPEDLKQGALGQGTGAPAAGSAVKGNIFYRKGGIEFWYKPDFDWSIRRGATWTPIRLACGYVFASRVYYNPGDPTVDANTGHLVPAPLSNSPTDGTQLYVFRNTEGQIRATRLYFRVVGDPASAEKDKPDKFVDQIPGDPYPATPGTHFTSGGSFVVGSGTGGAIELYKEAAERRPWVLNPPPTVPPGYIWPPAELKPDTLIKRARNDAYVDFDRLKQWRAHEWHHVAIAWDDSQTDTNRALRIYVDGVLASVAHGLPNSPSGDNENLFVRLNEPPERVVDGQRQQFPKDELYVAGIVRNLAKTSTGMFKQVNQIPPYGTETPIRTQIRLYANGTMDDFVVWDLQSGATRDRLQRVLQYGRYERQGEYVQHFDLSSKFPSGNNPIQLARLSVIALLPTHHGENQPAPGGRGSVVVKIDQPAGIQMRNPRTGQMVSGLTVSRMNDYQHVELLGASGQPVLLVPPANPLAPRPKLRYKVTLRPAMFQAGGQTPEMQAIETPILQEVSLSWFLPTEETLLIERLVD